MLQIKPDFGYCTCQVYDGDTTAAPVLASYSGTVLPTTLYSTGHTMLIHFLSDGSVTYPGYQFTWISTGGK